MLTTDAAMTTPNDWTKAPSVVSTLRAVGIRRSSSRHGRTSTPRTLRRSVGRTSGNADGVGTIVPIDALRTSVITTSSCYTNRSSRSTCVTRSTITAVSDLTDASLGVRPFNARSLVLSVLLGLPEPRLPAAAVARLAEPFGIAPGTMRTALSRMVAAGELTNHGGSYELRGRLLERKEAQDIGRRPPRDAWDGTWWIAVVTVPNRTVAERREFRAHMVNARMGELRPETWLRPANLDGPSVGHEVAVTRGRVDGPSADELAHTLWDLPAIDASVPVAHRRASTSRDLPLPAMMMRAAAVVRFLREEPLLPRPLTPDDWRADELRERYRDLDRTLGRMVRVASVRLVNLLPGRRLRRRCRTAS